MRKKSRSKLVSFILKKLIELGYNDISCISIEYLNYEPDKTTAEFRVEFYRGRKKLVNLVLTDNDQIFTMEDIPFPF